MWGWLCQHCHPGLYREWEESQLEDAGPGFTVPVQVSLPVAPCHSLFVLSSQIQTRNIRHLPDILVINCEVNSLKEADFWRVQAEVKTGAGNRALGVLSSFLPLLTSICDYSCSWGIGYFPLCVQVAFKMAIKKRGGEISKNKEFALADW